MSKNSAYLKNVIFPYLLPRKPECCSNRENYENAFSNTVLVGNWYESRLVHKKDKKAITPGIYGNSGCMKDVSVYQSDFKQPVAKNSSEEYAGFVNWSQLGFHNRLNASISNINFSHGDQFVNNLTTLKDVMYRIMPKQDVNCHILMPKKEKRNDDYMRSFGNSTRTGLLQYRICEKYRDENTPVDVSHYKNNFKPFKINKPIVKHKGLQRKTSLIGED